MKKMWAKNNKQKMIKNMTEIIFTTIQQIEPKFEVVERKGLGHPDTLADALAESLSRKYSKYTQKRFGVILHHNFDKLGLLGGTSFVAFGKGYLVKPIRVLLNGRASAKYGDTEIPIKKLFVKWSKSFFKRALPYIDLEDDLEFHYNINTASSPGRIDGKFGSKGTRKYWFEPRGLDDLRELKYLGANDTSLGCGYAPYSKLEKMILRIEEHLNSLQYKKSNKWLGSDIKVMGIRYNSNFSITLCIPQIANYVRNISEYKGNLKKVRKDIGKIIRFFYSNNYELNINTRDDYYSRELYLTAIGSSIESGDEGLVGRGNRVNGLISSTKPISMEGACGKNPVYHVGKLYNVAANRIANLLYKKTKNYCEVFFISQSGRKLVDPWKVIIALGNPITNNSRLVSLIEKEIKRIPKLTKEILDRKVRLF